MEDRRKVGGEENEYEFERRQSERERSDLRSCGGPKRVSDVFNFMRGKRNEGHHKAPVNIRTHVGLRS